MAARQIQLAALNRRKSDLAEQADQLRHIACLEFFEPLTRHQRGDNLNQEFVGAGKPMAARFHFEPGCCCS
jgi:hypothetical protein